MQMLGHKQTQISFTTSPLYFCYHITSKEETNQGTDI
uniref:Uncharacterized protein n=1 Tax=Rhizophora mucronata TaxID=61149 RepID=A0A2P2MRW9_RHIMU